MNFLLKAHSDVALHSDLIYPRDRDRAIEILLGLQKGFCAYSERFLKPLDSVELEHFDPRKKNTDDDGFSNWHAVIRWMNAHKARTIAKYEPLPNLSDWMPTRVWYEGGLFCCSEDDHEAINLIHFLGVNRREVFDERKKHIDRLRNMREKVGVDMLIEIFAEYPDQLSFPTAIEAELGIPAFDLIYEHREPSEN
jgi:hypothetical protein